MIDPADPETWDEVCDLLSAALERVLAGASRAGETGNVYGQRVFLEKAVQIAGLRNDFHRRRPEKERADA